MSESPFDLKGKTALVTGGSRNMGRAYTFALARAGSARSARTRIGFRRLPMPGKRLKTGGRSTTMNVRTAHWARWLRPSALCGRSLRMASSTTIVRSKACLIPRTRKQIASLTRRLSQFGPAKEAMSEFGGPCGDRTHDLRIKSPTVILTSVFSDLSCATRCRHRYKRGLTLYGGTHRES